MKLPLSLALLALSRAALAQQPPVVSAPDVTAPSQPEVARPVRAALVTTSAFGVTHARFFNQLAGARLEYRFTPRFAFGGAVSYANLKGKDRRMHNVLPELGLAYRIPLKGERFGVPFRYGLGFLPKNGPTLRLGAGVDFALSDAVSLELTPAEVMVWVNRERPEVSLNASLALGVAF
jgi:hypothetical protein